LTEHEVCDLCANPNRDDELLCVVESPGDVRVIEQAVDYRGRYFVLGGRLSPVEGLGPAELGLDLLAQRLEEGVVREVVLSTNPTLEGQATAQYIADICARYEVQATRIAYGVPLGSELEFIDSGTLAHAFAGRAKLD
jgi:recombination protein RecR